jgi:AraC-like DNA-binding protein
LRIEEAKNLIGQGETDSFTLQSISFRCGFSSQNTFIRAFKNATGKTPSTYLKSVSSKGFFVVNDKMQRQKS